MDKLTRDELIEAAELRPAGVSLATVEHFATENPWRMRWTENQAYTVEHEPVRREHHYKFWQYLPAGTSDVWAVLSEIPKKTGEGYSINLSPSYPPGVTGRPYRDILGEDRLQSHLGWSKKKAVGFIIERISEFIDAFYRPVSVPFLRQTAAIAMDCFPLPVSKEKEGFFPRKYRWVAHENGVWYLTDSEAYFGAAHRRIFGGWRAISCSGNNNGMEARNFPTREYAMEFIMRRYNQAGISSLGCCFGNNVFIKVGVRNEKAEEYARRDRSQLTFPV